MKSRNFLLLTILCLASLSASAQTAGQMANDRVWVDTAPTGACLLPRDSLTRQVISSGDLWYCRVNLWTQLTGSGVAGLTVNGTTITSGGANRLLFENSSSILGNSAGIGTDGASKITLGVAASSVGSIDFRNATSGAITLQPVTGALGTATLSLPAITDTLVGLAATQTLSAKTLDNTNSFSGYFNVTRIAAPSNPSAGSLRLFANNTTGKLACLDSSGTDCMPSSGGGVSDGDKGDITVSGTGTVYTIDSNAVTNAKLATVATATFKGRTTAGTGAVEDLTATQATALLNTMVGDSGSGGTKGLVPAPTTGDATKFLRGDATWVSIAGGGDALIANPLSQFAATTSAQLAGVISDETGSGASVFANSPTLITPNLGTPSALTLTNATGLPVATGISGLGTGIATFLATPSSANLASAVTNETGSGVLVFGTSPSLTTPAIAGGTATGLTSLGIRSSGTGAFDVTLANSENLTTGRTLTFALGDANRTLTIGASASVSGANTGDQTITLTGDVTGSGTGSFAATIANNVVTNAKLATVATATFKGRATAGTGNVEDLTATQATALLNAMVGDSGSGGTKGLVPAPTTGDAAKYLRGDGTWQAVGSGDFSSNTASSVDGEIVLFSGTGGKTGKRATGTGLAKVTSGVLSTATGGVDYETPLIFSTGLTRSGGGVVTVNGEQIIAKITNLTTNGLMKTSGGDGTLGIATAGTDYVAPSNLGSTFSGSGPFDVNQAYAFTWTARHDWSLGTTPQAAIRLTATDLGVNGSRDSHFLEFRSHGRDSGVNTYGAWRVYSDATDNFGSSGLLFRNAVATSPSSYSDVFRINDYGGYRLPASTNGSPTDGDVWRDTSTGKFQFYENGGIREFGAGFYGSSVASASTITVTGNIFHVTGTTTITSVSGTGVTAGTTITIIFDGALTFTDGSNLKLNGNFVTTADDTITLVYDGTNWHEVARSAN